MERGTRNTILMVEKNLSKDLIREKIEKHCNEPIRLFADDYAIYFDLEDHSKVKEHHIIKH